MNLRTFWSGWCRNKELYNVQFAWIKGSLWGHLRLSTPAPALLALSRFLRMIWGFIWSCPVRMERDRDLGTLNPFRVRSGLKNKVGHTSYSCEMGIHSVHAPLENVNGLQQWPSPSPSPSGPGRFRLLPALKFGDFVHVSNDDQIGPTPNLRSRQDLHRLHLAQFWAGLLKMKKTRTGILNRNKYCPKCYILGGKFQQKKVR